MTNGNRTPDGEQETVVSGSSADLTTRMAMVVDLYNTKSMAARAAGISPEQLARQIKGQNRPFFDTMVALCAHHGVSLDWLATGKGAMRMTDREREAAIDSGTFVAADEMLLGNLVAGLEQYLVREDLILRPEAKARLTVLIYRLQARRRADLVRQGLPVPAELRAAGHPIDIAADPDLADIIHLAG